MKAIENIKKSICNYVVFSINTEKGLPELSWIGEKSKEFREYAKEGLERMKQSDLFTEEELQDVANYAEEKIGSRARIAWEVLRELKRDAYKF